METALEKLNRYYQEIPESEKIKFRADFDDATKQLIFRWKTKFENKATTLEDVTSLRILYLGDQLIKLHNLFNYHYPNVPDSVISKLVFHFDFLEMIYAYENIIATESETAELENDYSGENELSPKEKLILLDKLGIIDFLNAQLVQADNASHLVEIIQSFSGIKISKASLVGYCNYLVRRNDSPNSPYGSKDTVDKVNRIYNTFRLKDKTD